MISDGRLKEIVAGIDIHEIPFPDDTGDKECTAEVSAMAEELLDRRRTPAPRAGDDRQMARALDEPRNAQTAFRADGGPAVRAASGDPADRLGGPDHNPFKIYARGEGRPFDIGGDEPVVFGALRFYPIDDTGNVTLTAEGLRDLCNYVYRDSWRFGHLAPRAGTAAFPIREEQRDIQVIAESEDGTSWSVSDQRRSDGAILCCASLQGPQAEFEAGRTFQRDVDAALCIGRRSST